MKPKRDPLPADPREAIRELTGRAEDLSRKADDARRRADDALDLAQDVAELAEAIHHLTDAWRADHDRDDVTSAWPERRTARLAEMDGQELAALHIQVQDELRRRARPAD